MIRRSANRGPQIESILGSGGFFKAEDPIVIKGSYRTLFGIDPVSRGYETPCWSQEAGETFFTSFVKVTDLLGNLERAFKLNSRVRKLDKVAAQSEAAGIEELPEPNR